MQSRRPTKLPRLRRAHAIGRWPQGSLHDLRDSVNRTKRGAKDSVEANRDGWPASRMSVGDLNLGKRDERNYDRVRERKLNDDHKPTFAFAWSGLIKKSKSYLTTSRVVFILVAIRLLIFS